MRKKWIAILVAAFAGIFVLVWFVGIQNASKISFNKDGQSTSIAKKIKTTPDAEWILDPEIPANYVPVPGETDIFMVLNPDGTVKEYRKRTRAQDGTWYWETIQNPTNMEIKKITETEYGDVYKLSNGEFEEFKRFVVDTNNGFAWVDTDEFGLPLSLPEGTDIPDYYKPVNDNTYAVYNDNGVLESYLKRLSDGNGGFNWQLTGMPEMLAYTSFDREDPNVSQDDVSQNLASGFQFGEVSFDNEVWSAAGDTKTSTSSYTWQKEVDGFVITFETVITKTEDKDGNLISTKKEDFEKGRTPKAEVNNNGDIASSLGAEANRIGNGLSWQTGVDTEVLDMINAERVKNKKTPVATGNANLNNMAKIKAADMAITGITTKNSATYGSVQQLANKYGVQGNFVEAVLETMPTDASTIYQKFMTDNALRDAMLNCKNFSLMNCLNNGRYYISMILEIW